MFLPKEPGTLSFSATRKEPQAVDDAFSTSSRSTSLSAPLTTPGVKKNIISSVPLRSVSIFTSSNRGPSSLPESSNFVLTEEIAESYPFHEGKDFVSFSSDQDLIEKVRHYLGHPDERESIAKSGHLAASTHAQAEIFRVLHTELQRLHLQRAFRASTLVDHALGIQRNATIDFFDLLAKLKGRITGSRKHPWGNK